MYLTDTNRESIEAILPTFRLTLREGASIVETGLGANVLDSPALAVTYLADVLSTQPNLPPLAADELITTGTITDARPVTRSETWSSNYGALPVPGLTLTLL